MALENFIAASLCNFAKLLTGVRAIWQGCPPNDTQRIYFANHTSHGDFVLIWAALPPALRRRTRPVAAADYWLGEKLRRYLALKVFRGVLITRVPKAHQANPLDQMGAALAEGDSLILFPEGTRNPGEGLQPLKSGIHHLARAHPEVELVPVWIENLGRAMPKGSLIPVPLLCTLCFGPPMHLQAGESREDFLARARNALLELSPPAN